MRLLVFGIHPDDVELGCGGIVAVHARAGRDVVIADLTRGEASSNGTPAERAEEARVAAEILGCRNRLNAGLPDSGLRSDDPRQQRALVEIIRDVRPDVVVVPSGDDPHPDHASGAVLIERSLYLAGIHGYAPGRQGAWKARAGLLYSGRREVRMDVVVDTSAVHDVKMAAIRAHETQFGGGEGARPTPLNAPDFLSVIEARDRLHGHAIGVRFGEALQVATPLALPDIGAVAGVGEK